jgi:hypothetical protein
VTTAFCSMIRAQAQAGSHVTAFGMGQLYKLKDSKMGSTDTNGCSLLLATGVCQSENEANYPSIAFAAAASVAFAAITAVVLALTCKYGGRFMYIVFATGIAEVLGYSTRIIAADSTSLGAFIGSTFFLLVSPIALAPVNYLVMARLVRQVDKPVWMLCTLKPDQIARFFVTSDFVCFFLQASGGGLLAIADPNVNNLGAAIVLVGLAIQLFFFTGFSWITYRIATRDEYLLKFAPAVRPVFVGLAITIVFLYVRNI